MCLCTSCNLQRLCSNRAAIRVNLLNYWEKLIDQMPLFAGILQAPETSSKLSHCFHTAEVAGSIPASPTPVKYCPPLLVLNRTYPHLIHNTWGLISTGGQDVVVG